MTPRISTDELLSELRRLNDKYGKATSTLMREHGKYSTRTYSLRFGSWSEALQEAGLDINREQNISEENLIKELQRLADQLGETPREADMDSKGKYSRGPYKNQFGSWNDVIKEAGLTPNVRKDISKSELREELQRLAEELGRPPRKYEMTNRGKFGSATYKRKFGSWSNAIIDAGLELSNIQKRYSEEELLQKLRDIGNEIEGDLPSTKDLERLGGVTVATYRNRFGSWNEALEKAGFELPPKYAEINAQRLREELNEVADYLGRTPTRSEMDEYSETPTNWYYREFDSWIMAIREAGLEPVSQPNQYSDKELLKEVNALAKRVGRTPRQEDMEQYGEFSVSTYNERFGSWNQTLERCGLEPVHRHNISRSELLEALTDLANQVEHIPTANDMDALGEFSSAPYFGRFDSWRDALEKAGLEPTLRYEDVTREQLLIEIKRVNEIVDQVPKVFDIREHSNFKDRWYYREFGSWSTALRAAGFDPHRNHDISNEELLNDLRRVAANLDRAPTVSEMNDFGSYPPSLLIGRFSTWNDALREAELEPRKRSEIPDDELEEEFYRLKDALGHVPSGAEMTELGTFSVGVYGLRFGSWNDAVRTFGEDPRFVRSGEGETSHYGAIWEERREEIIQRDDEECIVCGLQRHVHVETFDKDLTVHHIERFLPVYERTGSYEIAHRQSNLVTVCVQCHPTVEGKPKEYFKSLVPDGVLDEAGKSRPNRTLFDFYE